MISFIDGFTERFVNQIGKIETQRRELATYVGEDRRQGDRIKYLQNKLIRINEILKLIEDTQPNMRAELVKNLSNEMAVLENPHEM